MSFVSPKSSATTWIPKALLPVLAVFAVAAPSAGHDADSLVQQLKSESFAQTTRLLRDGEQYAFPTHGGTFDPAPGFEHVLANRRSLKFVADLGRMPLDDRISILKKEMSSLCDSYLDTTKACIALCEDSHPSTNATGLSGQLHKAFGLKGSILTMLFAASHTANEDTLTSLLLQSERLSLEVKKMCNESDALRGAKRRMVLDRRAPNREDVVNLVMHCRRKTDGFSDLADYTMPNSVEKAVVQLVPWDARTVSREVQPRWLRDSLNAPSSADIVVIYRFCRGAQTTDDIRTNEDALDRFDLAVSAIDFNAMCTRYR